MNHMENAIKTIIAADGRLVKQLERDWVEDAQLPEAERSFFDDVYSRQEQSVTAAELARRRKDDLYQFANS